MSPCPRCSYTPTSDSPHVCARELAPAPGQSSTRLAKNKNPSPGSQPRTNTPSQLLTSSLHFLCLCSLHLEVPAGYFGILTNLFCESTPVFLQVLFPARFVPHLFCHTGCFQCVYVLTTCLLFVPSARLQPPFVSVFATECHAQPAPRKTKLMNDHICCHRSASHYRGNGSSSGVRCTFISDSFWGGKMLPSSLPALNFVYFLTPLAVVVSAPSTHTASMPLPSLWHCLTGPPAHHVWVQRICELSQDCCGVKEQSRTGCLDTVKSEKENLVSFTENGKVSPNRLIFPSLAPRKVTHDRTAAKVFYYLFCQTVENGKNKKS